MVAIYYISFQYKFPDFIPAHVPPGGTGNMDAHAITASALQETAGLMVTISLALSALFGFGVSKFIGDDSIIGYICLVLTAVFGISLAAVMLFAYNVYYAIIAQSDLNVFFLDMIDPLLTIEIQWLMSCAVLSVTVLFLRYLTWFQRIGG